MAAAALRTARGSEVTFWGTRGIRAADGYDRVFKSDRRVSEIDEGLDYSEIVSVTLHVSPFKSACLAIYDFHKLNPVTERIRHVGTQVTVERLIVDALEAGLRKCQPQRTEIVDDKSRMRLPCRVKVLLDPEV